MSILHRRPQFGIELASLAVFFGIWQLASMRWNPVLFPSPGHVITAFINLVSNGQLQSAIAVSIKDLVVGFLLAVVVGVPVGLAMGRSRRVEDALNPYVSFMQSTPPIALVPLLIIWFGIDFRSRVAVVFMFAVWTLIINSTAGVKGTPRILMDVARVYHLSRWRMTRDITLPNAVPFIWAGLRISLGKALMGMIIAEMEVSVVGVGKLVFDYGQLFQTAYMLAGVFSVSVIGVATMVLLGWSLGRFFPWVEATAAGRK